MMEFIFMILVVQGVVLFGQIGSCFYLSETICDIRETREKLEEYLRDL